MCTHVYSTVTLPGTPALFYPKPGICQGNLTLELGIGWISIAVQVTNVDDTKSSYEVSVRRVVFNPDMW